MNTEIVVSFGLIPLLAIVLQQIFIVYAIYAIFVRPKVKNSIRGRLLNIIRNRYTQGEIDTVAYRKLEKDIINLES